MALSGLAMLADTLRETSRGASQCSGDSDDSGLLALSAAADDVEEKPPKDPAESLKLYAAAVEKEERGNPPTKEKAAAEERAEAEADARFLAALGRLRGVNN